MTQLSDSILDLKRTFVCEMLDIAYPHLAWTSQHLQDSRYDRALIAFDKLVAAVREAAIEMKAMRSALDAKKAEGEAAAAYRADQDQRKPRTSAAA